MEFKQAYEKGTRSYDGKVTGKYWQNAASYDLKVKVDPSQKLLQGSGSVKYTNNSPDSLNTVVLQAYHNYYKFGAGKESLLAHPSNENNNEGMVLDEIVLQEAIIDLKDDEIFESSGTYCAVTLFDPLASGESVDIHFKWHYTIPGKGFERSGAIDSTSMFVAYWYPEIAVIDDIHGWDKIEYDASAEFYHDVSNFKVEIEVPDNYIVWSSSPLKNPIEVLPEKFLKRLQKAKNSSESVTIVGQGDLENGIVMKSNIWKYEIAGIPDFAFALSDDFIWEAANYQDDMGKYMLNIAYDPENPEFTSVLKAQQESLKIFHYQFPKHPFPYQHFTIFNGLEGGGMEFPGMANDEAYNGEEFSNWLGYEVSDYRANLGLTLHEMFHMYFPFMMGINEKRYAWMDEGWAEFAECFSPQGLNFKYDNEYITKHWVVPMMVPTYTRPDHSWINSYTIGAYSYYSLYHLLGAETFDRCIKAFIDRWKGKHPTPYDFFFTFNDVSGKNLNWFWEQWYFSFGYPDLKNRGLKNNELTIENVGGKPLAFELIYTFNDDSKKSEFISPECWKSNEIFTKELLNGREIKSIQLKSGSSSDAIFSNNTWKSTDK